MPKSCVTHNHEEFALLRQRSCNQRIGCLQENWMLCTANKMHVSRCVERSRTRSDTKAPRGHHFKIQLRLKVIKLFRTLWLIKVNILRKKIFNSYIYPLNVCLYKLKDCNSHNRQQRANICNNRDLRYINIIQISIPSNSIRLYKVVRFFLSIA